MNILPKKRWHVRTKDNIARVRRDEAEAAEQERKRVEKLEYAESEARLNILRSKAGATGTSATQSANAPSDGRIITSDGHVDLFSDFQSHIKTINKEHEKEKKEEKEKYEKQIGYLTYLGQDTNEALKLRSWYEVAPDRSDVYDQKVVEKDLKTKYLNDPLTLIKTLLPEDKPTNKAKPKPVPVVPAYTPPIRKEVFVETPQKVKKPKKDKKHKKDKKKKKKKEKDSRSELDAEEQARKNELINRLRKERLKREARERARQEELLCPKVDKPKVVEEVRPGPRIVQKYNSQFNPELAKQNMA